MDTKVGVRIFGGAAMRRIVLGENATLESIRTFMANLPEIRSANDCWEWVGSKFTESDYGRFSTKINGKDFMHRAHQFSYWIHTGEIPEWLVVMHTCDNPICVNPNHLKLGTSADNTADMIAKGRKHKLLAEESGGRKITTPTALTIRGLIEESTMSLRDIATHVGVGTGIVREIAAGTTWKELGPRPNRPVGACYARSKKITA